jgi:alpha-tubulin suppressor-like RCC1 family protein
MWGPNYRGQLGNGAFDYSHTPVRSGALTGVVAVAAGYDLSLALRQDGTVWAWGFDYYSCLQNESLQGAVYPSPVQVPGLSNIVAIAAGWFDSVALRNDGTVWTWGGTGAYKAPAQVPGLTGITAIAADGANTMALGSDGSVWAWGDDTDGEVGDGQTNTSVNVPTRVLTGGFQAIACGTFTTPGQSDGFSLALAADGTVWGWGSNGSNALVPWASGDWTTPSHIYGPSGYVSGVASIAAGSGYVLALRQDGTVLYWGGGTYAGPTPVAGLSNIAAVAAGDGTCFAIGKDGSVYAWGNDSIGQLGDGQGFDGTEFSDVESPERVPALDGATAIASGFDYTEMVEFPKSNGGFSLSLRPDGTVWAFGGNAFGQLGTGACSAHPVPSQVVGLTGVTDLCGSTAVLQDGSVWAWGDNRYDQLGVCWYWYDPATLASAVPVRVAGLPNAVAVAQGTDFRLALCDDGNVWVWGASLVNAFGDSAEVPAQVPGLSDVTAIAAGDQMAMALKSDGTVWMWGDNTYGELGNGSTVTSSSTPGQVVGLSDVVAISAGYQFSAAVRSDGTVWTWGGDSDSGQSNVPVQVKGLSGVTALATSEFGCYALDSDGTVWTTVPSQVTGLPTITAIALSVGTAYALAADGSVWAWGLNMNGELGHLPGTDGDQGFISVGTQLDYVVPLTWYNDTPAPVPGLSGVTAITAGGAVAPLQTSVSGSVNLVGAVSNAQTVDFAFHQPGGLTFSLPITPAANGAFTVPVPPGAYNIGINGSKWLRTTLSSVSVTGMVGNIDATLTPGDVNGDNVIDLQDFALFAAAFGSDPTSPNWNPNADLNCDGVVDLSDFSLFAQFFGDVGDPAP